MKRNQTTEHTEGTERKGIFSALGVFSGLKNIRGVVRERAGIFKRDH